MSEEAKAAVVLRLPSTLSTYSGGKSQLQLQANTVEQLFVELSQKHPLVWQHLCDEQGRLREHVKIFVNNEMITAASDDLDIPLKEGQEIIVLPVVTGFSH